MADRVETEQVRALLALAREYGVVQLEAGPVKFTLAPQIHPLRPVHASKPVDDDDEDDDAAQEQRSEEAARTAWNQHWGRMLRSSGAPTPPFPGRAKMRELGLLDS